MAKSNIVFKLLDNDIVGGFVRVIVNPDGNSEKWLTTTFTSTDTGNYYDCEVGSNISETITNLKAQLDNYYTGTGLPQSAYTITITSSDTLNIELNEEYLGLEVQDFTDGKADIIVNSVLNVKYIVEYFDVVNVPHKFELFDPNYFAAPIEEAVMYF